MMHLKHSDIELIPLICPACEAEVDAADGECVEGNLVRCEHCGIEAALTREWDERIDTYHWILIDLEMEDDDERR